MESALTLELGREFDVSEARQRAVARVDSEKSVSLTTSTRENPMSDEFFFFAAYRALLEVDELLGKIAMIEGLPRNAYQPFRTEVR
jgi:hypothetical protein